MKNGTPGFRMYSVFNVQSQNFPWNHAQGLGSGQGDAKEELKDVIED